MPSASIGKWKFLYYAYAPIGEVVVNGNNMPESIIMGITTTFINPIPSLEPSKYCKKQI